VRDYVRAVANGPDATRPCQYLSEAAQQDLIEFARNTLDQLGVAIPEHLRVESCADGYSTFVQFGAYSRTLAGVMDYCLADKFPETVKVQSVAIAGDRAVARVAGSEKAVQLQAVDGEWKIDSQDFSDAPAVDESPAEARRRSCRLSEGG
jgi:hypothetical protein